MQVHNQRTLTTIFLGRLARLVLKEIQAQTPGEQALISKAILSTYRDCRDLGVTGEAERILRVRRTKLPTDA
jgi:hypothetical protein